MVLWSLATSPISIRQGAHEGNEGLLLILGEAEIS
jgi:hypothetical protein